MASITHFKTEQVPSNSLQNTKIWWRFSKCSVKQMSKREAWFSKNILVLKGSLVVLRTDIQLTAALVSDRGNYSVFRFMSIILYVEKGEGRQLRTLVDTEEKCMFCVFASGCRSLVYVSMPVKGATSEIFYLKVSPVWAEFSSFFRLNLLGHNEGDVCLGFSDHLDW